MSKLFDLSLLITIVNNILKYICIYSIYIIDYKYYIFNRYVYFICTLFNLYICNYIYLREYICFIVVI